MEVLIGREIMDASEFQKQLEETFISNGVIDARMLGIMTMEDRYRQFVIQRFYGPNLLAESFLDFFLTTIELAIEWVRQHGLPSTHQYYSPILLLYITNFKRLRAAEILFLKGYPLQGYALLRDLKDQAIVVAAIMNGLTSYRAISGEGDPVTMKKIKWRRKKEEQKVRASLLREESGLDKNHQDELERWEELFHLEVHGSRLTSAEGIDWLLGNARLSIGPTQQESSIAMYMNRFSEIGWMLLRTFPFLQVEPLALGEKWAKEWKVWMNLFAS